MQCRDTDQSTLTMFFDMLPYLSQGVADRSVVVEGGRVLARLPLHKTRQLLADGLEQADNDSYWSALHVVAELLHLPVVWLSVVAVKLHQLPYRQECQCDHQDSRPMSELVALIH